MKKKILLVCTPILGSYNAYFEIPVFFKNTPKFHAWPNKRRTSEDFDLNIAMGMFFWRRTDGDVGIIKFLNLDPSVTSLTPNFTQNAPIPIKTKENTKKMIVLI